MTGLAVAALAVATIVYGASAAAKLRGRGAYVAYRDSLGEAMLVRGPLLPAAAALLAGFEAVTAVSAACAIGLLVVSVPGSAEFSAGALAAAAVLTGMLALGVAVIVRRGAGARCACFGSASARPLGKAHLVRNGALLAATLAGLTANALGSGRLTLGSATVAVASGFVAGLLLVRLDELIEVFAPIQASSHGSVS